MHFRERSASQAREVEELTHPFGFRSFESRGSETCRKTLVKCRSDDNREKSTIMAQPELAVIPLLLRGISLVRVLSLDYDTR